MLIFVKIFPAKIVMLDVKPSDTIDIVKAKLQEEEGIPLFQQHLFLAKQQLEGGRTLGYYGIEKEATLMLMLCLRGGARIRQEV
jgi:ubiquitin